MWNDGVFSLWNGHRHLNPFPVGSNFAYFEINLSREMRSETSLLTSAYNANATPPKKRLDIIIFKFLKSIIAAAKFYRDIEISESRDPEGGES